MADQTTTAVADNDVAERAPDKPARDLSPPKPKRRIGLIVFLLIAAIAGVALYFFLRYTSTYETTDDAEIGAHFSSASARIAGTVMGVYVEENQIVQAGQPIADLDARDYQVALDQVRGQLAQAQAQLEAEHPNIPIIQETNETTISTTGTDVDNAQAALSAAERDAEAALADVQQAEANNVKAQGDIARYKPLADKDEVPREQYDQVVATARAQEAVVASKRASAAAAQKTVEQRRFAVEQAKARLREATQNAPRQVAVRRANVAGRQAAIQTTRAELERAQLDLSYTKIFAPVSGVVTHRTVEVGQRVSSGQQIVQIAQIADLWATANFKETQLHRMHPGQRATIHVDAFKREFEGTVESMPAATGSITSLLPPENATGNYVKVVQRMPVRIRFTPGQAGLEKLRPGMSVVPKVWLD